MNTWPDTVPMYPAGGSTKSTDMNQPIQALIDRTDYLKSVVDQIASNKRLLSQCNKLADDTTVGDAVYFDLTTGLFQKGMAKWNTTLNADGSLSAAESALILGFIISKETASSGVICLYGELDDPAAIAAIFGVTPVPGIYYLSPTVAGHVTTTQPTVIVPCIFYTYEGRAIILENKAWGPNHIHKTFMMISGWLTVGNTQFTNMIKPAGAVYGYNIAGDYNLKSLFSIFPGAVKLSADGSILYANSVVVNDDNIWWVGAGNPNSKVNVECYSMIPFSYGEPIVRGARTDYPAELLISAVQGMLTINPVPWSLRTQEASGFAVSGVLGREYDRTPVISGLTSGTGAQVDVDPVTGAAVVSLERQVEALLDSELVDLSNAVQVASDPYILFSLPANRISYITGKNPIPKLGTDATFKAAAFMIAKGVTGGGTFPALTATLTFVPSPKTAPVNLAAATVVNTSFATFASSQGYLYYKETPAGDRITITTEGTLYVKIAAASGAYDKDIFRFGIIIYVAA